MISEISKGRTIESRESSMREPLKSIKIQSRKRKKFSSSSPNSNPFMSIFTRSKSRIYLHQNRSGLSRPDPVTRKPIPKMESMEAFMGVNCRSASRVLSNKLRLKRVFSPDVNSVPEEENEETNDERKKLLKGFDSSTVPASDVDDVKEHELEKSGIVRYDERFDGENGLNLKDRAIHGNESLPKNKLALNGCHRRKVFKTPSSFSYKRLLPHLMDIVNDTSSVSKIEIVDAGSPYKSPKLDGDYFELSSFSENSYAAKTKCVVRQFSDSKPSENQGLEKVQLKVFSIQSDLSAADNELGWTADFIRPLEVEGKGNKNEANGVGASVEEHIQTTPPDPGIFAKTEDGYGGEYVDASKVLAESKSLMGFPVGSEKSSSDALEHSPNTNHSTNSMNKPVFNPCSRLRLFKNPRSLSYRRLLPFLMDMSKTNSCSSRKPQQKMPQVVLEEDRHPAPATSAERECVNNTTKIYDKRYSEDLIQNFPSPMVPQPASDGSSPDSNNNLVSSIPQSSATDYSSNVGPRSFNSVTLHDPGMPNGLQTEEIPQCQSTTKLQLGLESKESSSVSEPFSVNTKQCTSEEPRSVEKKKMCSNMGLELHNDNAESIELVHFKQHSFLIKASDALVSPNNKNFKGILKRNRRGCRGLCNCLNCSSFRLHAERAFEFSRNQLHDAEEVASELMKELANLRLLLEKSITGNDDSVSIRSNLVLVKQACNKALETETLAKERLDELNNDLSVHCRIPVLLQPKVTFAQRSLNEK